MTKAQRRSICWRFFIIKAGSSREAGKESGAGLPEGGGQMREALLTLLLNVTSRLLLRSDRMNGIMEQMLNAFTFANERLVIPSGKRRLSAVYVSAGDEDSGGFDLSWNWRTG